LVSPASGVALREGYQQARGALTPPNPKLLLDALPTQLVAI
jgi:hypothetical protein